MTTTSYPGVYMREVSSGVRPIQAASTSIAAFLGKAERGPIGTAVRIFNFTEFQTVFGGFLTDFYLAHAVYQFFNNGGSQCSVVRVAHGADIAAGTIKDRGDTPRDTLKVAAASPGVWGNTLEIAVGATEDEADTFDLEVHRSGMKETGPVERFPGLSMDPKSPRYVEDVVTARSRLITATVVSDGQNATAGQVEGSALPTTAPLLDTTHRVLQISIDGDPFQPIDLTDADVSTQEKLRAALETAIRTIAPLRGSTAADAYLRAEVALVGEENDPKRLRITSGTKGAGSTVRIRRGDDAATDATGLLGLTSPTAADGGAALRPAMSGTTRYLLGDGAASETFGSITKGTDGDTPTDLDYKNALHALDTVRDISLIAIPGIGSAALAGDAMAYCKLSRPLSDCFFIADMAGHDVTLKDAQDWCRDLSVANSYGAVYFPWLLMADPNGGPQPIPAPPSGYVAGIYARTDNERGVWKTPAGTAASIAGAVGLVTELTDGEHGNLNTPEKSVSVIRRFPSSGLVVWGGRALSEDAEWRYIAPRRMAIFLRISVFAGIQWAVFEPNDAPLWSQLRLNIDAFMSTLFRKGAFQGSTPDEAYFVKVDSETTTQADIDAGTVNILLGFAPLKPAEFVVVSLSQKAGQSS